MMVQLSFAGGIGCHLVLALAVIVLTATMLAEAMTSRAGSTVIVDVSVILAVAVKMTAGVTVTTD